MPQNVQQMKIYASQSFIYNGLDSEWSANLKMHAASIIDRIIFGYIDRWLVINYSIEKIVV